MIDEKLKSQTDVYLLTHPQRWGEMVHHSKYLSSKYQVMAWVTNVLQEMINILRLLQNVREEWHCTAQKKAIIHQVTTLKGHRGLAGPDCQHVVIDEFLCMVSRCALETYVCHWIFKQKSTWSRSRRSPTTYKNVLFPCYNQRYWWPDTLITAWVPAKREVSSVPVVSKWLWPGNRTFIEVASMWLPDG